MDSRSYTDVSANRHLSDLPGFNRWQNRPLNRQLKQLINELDEQTLMSLTAEAMQRIQHGPTGPRRIPI